MADLDFWSFGFGFFSHTNSTRIRLKVLKHEHQIRSKMSVVAGLLDQFLKFCDSLNIFRSCPFCALLMSDSFSLWNEALSGWWKSNLSLCPIGWNLRYPSIIGGSVTSPSLPLVEKLSTTIAKSAFLTICILSWSNELKSLGCVQKFRSMIKFIMVPKIGHDFLLPYIYIYIFNHKAIFFTLFLFVNTLFVFFIWIYFFCSFQASICLYKKIVHRNIFFLEISKIKVLVFSPSPNVIKQLQFYRKNYKTTKKGFYREYIARKLARTRSNTFLKSEVSNVSIRGNFVFSCSLSLNFSVCLYHGFYILWLLISRCARMI